MRLVTEYVGPSFLDLQELELAVGKILNGLLSSGPDTKIDISFHWGSKAVAKDGIGVGVRSDALKQHYTFSRIDGLSCEHHARLLETKLKNIILAGNRYHWVEVTGDYEQGFFTAHLNKL